MAVPACTRTFHFASCVEAWATSTSLTVLSWDSALVWLLVRSVFWKPSTLCEAPFEARSEALNLALNELHYVTATAGKPVRGLFQDTVIGGNMLCSLDHLMGRSEFDQLCWIGCEQIQRYLNRGTIDREQSLRGLEKVDAVTNSNPFSATNDVKFLGALAPDGSVIRGSGDGYKKVTDDSLAFY